MLNTIWLKSDPSLITGFVSRVTQWVSEMEQELLTLPGHLTSPSGFSRVRVARSLVLCVVFCGSLVVLLSFCPFSFFGHCVVCPSPIDEFYLLHLVSSNSSYSNSRVVTLDNKSCETNPTEIDISFYLLNYIDKASHDMWFVMKSKHLIILLKLSCIFAIWNRYLLWKKMLDMIKGQIQTNLY